MNLSSTIQLHGGGPGSGRHKEIAALDEEWKRMEDEDDFVQA